jgi:hypothetical protein
VLEVWVYEWVEKRFEVALVYLEKEYQIGYRDDQSLKDLELFCGWELNWGSRLR